MSVPKPRPLSDSEWDRQQWIIREFELAWRRHEDPPIDRYLTLSLLENERLLIELAHVDLEFRIKAGLAPRVEDYLRRYPVLTRNRAWVVDLIRHEYRFRSRGERELKFASFRDRFPEYLDDFPTPDPSAGWSAASEVDKPGSDRNADLALPRDVGNFELRERLGVGSFGVVYRAFDRLARRDVVVKVPKSTVLTSQADIRSFAREARNSIDLKHPNIVSVHAIIQFDEMICLVREFVEGQTLAERLLESLYTPMDAARLMIVIARAVDYANQSGIIHRDLKPSNILIDRQGVPHVSDFGLARSEHGDTTLSPSVQSHVTIGTMEYMAPEQARGEGFLADARSDVFSLGTIFYQLLTNSLPFQGRNQMLLVQIQETEPKAPHCLNEEVPDGLEAICLKALAKNPAHRYQSAGLMAEDLQAFLENGPIQALPLPIGDSRKNRWPQPLEESSQTW